MKSWYDRHYSRVARGRKALHDYQNRAVKFLHDNPRSALFVDVGMGKSVICLTLLADLLREGWRGRALVVAPLRVAKATWPTEIGEWRQSAGIDYSLIRAENDDAEVKAAFDAVYKPEYARQRAVGEKPDMAARLARAKANPARADAKDAMRARQTQADCPLHIINIERLEWLVEYWEHRGRTTGETWPYDVVILDESSKFKDPSTNRFKALNRAMSRVDRIHELTASPASEGYEHLFAQVFLMDRGKRLGRNPFSYRAKYFHKVHARKWVMNRGADARIGEAIADICLTLKAEDYREQLGVEDWLPIKRKIRLDPEMQERYDDFEKSFVLKLDDLRVEALNAAALFNKLLQTTSGAVYDNEGKIVPVHDEKIEALRELRDEIGPKKPLMVCYWFKSSLARLRKAFPKAVVMDRAGKAVDDWNAGKIETLLIQPGSAGHGLNMQKGPGQDIAFFDLCWSRELYEQVIGRLSRQGQKHIVKVHHLLCVGTADEIVYDCLIDKGEGQARLFRYIQAARARYARNDNERTDRDKIAA